MGLAVAGRFLSLTEAYAAAGALRSAGVRAEVFDEHWGTMLWTQSDALGGFRVMVHADEIDDARAVLASAEASPYPLEDKPAEDWGLTPTLLLAAAQPLAGWGWVSVSRRPAAWKWLGFALLVVPVWLLGLAMLVMELVWYVQAVWLTLLP
ncbi:MAG TPA: DUF2007 domain-containing protein [Caulobacteraceae bacterium]|nr:DUF2007 domain-containing protein [Caulobacteraceae bacterium]